MFSMRMTSCWERNWPLIIDQKKFLHLLYYFSKNEKKKKKKFLVGIMHTKQQWKKVAENHAFSSVCLRNYGGHTKHESGRGSPWK